MSENGYRSYYGRPVIKEPVWKPQVAVYFFTGGLAGASSLLSAFARLRRHERLASASLYMGAAADAVSAALLVSDLGRPERFLNMLRVFKITSPMSVGSWVLAGSGTASGIAAGCELLGILPRTKLSAEALAALLGAPLATYTSVLVANTAVPVWHEARKELPFVFGASAAATAGAAAAVLLPTGEAGPARRLAVAGVVGEGVAVQAMERRLGSLAEPYRQGAAGRFARV
ncbi:MAG: polysulfide reductase NrfD, partial [Actinomycetota bacterium]|nr:polysulfide reductase NrfD [Actinomycetota bacterium]